VPAWRRPVMSRRSRRDDRQQREDDSNRQKHEARHKHTIEGRLLGGDSNLSAQRNCFWFACETTALHFRFVHSHIHCYGTCRLAEITENSKFNVMRIDPKNVLLRFADGNAYRHMPRMRAPTSMRGPWLAARAAAPATASGHVVFSNMPSSRSGINRDLEA
jgi:hypothetical protein